MKNTDKLQAVMNTLELLKMPASYDNVNYLTGIYRTLAEIRDDLLKAENAEAEEVGSDG